MSKKDSIALDELSRAELKIINDHRANIETRKANEEFQKTIAKLFPDWLSYSSGEDWRGGDTSFSSFVDYIENDIMPVFKEGQKKAAYDALVSLRICLLGYFA